MADEEKSPSMTQKLINAIVAIFVTVASAAIIGWCAFIFNNILDMRDEVGDLESQVKAISEIFTHELAVAQKDKAILREEIKNLKKELAKKDNDGSDDKDEHDRQIPMQIPSSWNQKDLNELKADLIKRQETAEAKYKK